MNLNTAIIAGRLTRDPELKALPSGTSVCNFSVAVDDSFVKDGVKTEKTLFVDVTVFGKQAENCSKYLVKGQQVLVDGKISKQSWEKDGQKHYKDFVVAKSVQFGAKPKGYVESNNLGNTSMTSPGVDGETINVNDIPF